ncbi:hypothetical protein BST61_g5929 [Cercospora zeina]
MQNSPHLLAGTEIYRPLRSDLQQFRVLIILPGLGAEELHCHLRIASLQHDVLPQYETISYAWGDRNQRSSITINNVTLNVPYSTKAALHRMRLAREERVVWIDAICINQNDLSERGAQVSIMATIYMYGTGNLVFLGDDEEQVAEVTVAALNFTHEKVMHALKSLDSEGRLKLDAGEVPYEWNFDSIINDVDLGVHERLYSLPWFRRLWVIQEIALAARNTCHWGSFQFPLPTALTVGAVLARHPFPFGHQVGGFEAAKAMNSYATFKWRTARVLNWGLLEFMQGFATFSASEPRDRVFAAVQLYRKWNDLLSIPPLLTPDYSKSVAEVYRDATRYIFEHRGLGNGMRLDSIQHRSPDDLDKTMSGFTSWTIRFDRVWDFFSFRSDPDPNIMTLRVLTIDTIATTTQAMTNEDTDDLAMVQTIIETLSSWTLPPVIAEVLSAGVLKTNIIKFRDIAQKFEAYQLFLQYITAHHELPHRLWQLQEDATLGFRHAAWFRALFSEASRHRRYFRTRMGWPGCGPKLMREGDVILVAQGANMPCVLRPVEGGNYYLFVGTAYVYGLMDGELFDGEMIQAKEEEEEEDDMKWHYVRVR